MERPSRLAHIVRSNASRPVVFVTSLAASLKMDTLGDTQQVSNTFSLTIADQQVSTHCPLRSTTTRLRREISDHLLKRAIEPATSIEG